MNTTITIVVAKTEAESTVEISDAIEAGFGEFDRVVKKFTRFNQDSELSNLNRNAGKWTQVSEELVDLVRQMLELSQATNGAFDPTVIDFLETYGYDPNYDFSKLDKPDLDKLVQKIASERPSWQEIELDVPNHKIKLARNQRIDLGGIGKGYAIDLAVDKLAKFENILVDGGGDIRARGVNEQGEDWKLGLKHMSVKSDAPEIIGQINSRDIALASSGSWARKVKQFHHIINPTTGVPAEQLQTVFVTAPTATLSDSWATALFVGGKELLANLPDGMGAMLIDKEDKVAMTDNFPNFVPEPYQETEDGNFTHNGKKYSLNKTLKISHHKPTVELYVKDLSWIINFSYEVIDGKKVCYSCRKGPPNWHEERIQTADTTVPIIVTESENKMVVLDGLHRLERALKDKLQTIPAKMITSEELETCLR